MKAKPHADGATARRVLVKGEPMVMLAEDEFDRLLRKADEWEPLLPERDADRHRNRVVACLVRGDEKGLVRAVSGCRR